MMPAVQKMRRRERTRSPLKPTPENEVHCMIADLLRAALKPHWLWWHTPNGELRNKAAAGRLKRMGVLPGVSDFLLMSPIGEFFALELKRRGKTPTIDQTDFLVAVRMAGHRSAWVDSFDDAVKVLQSWGALRITP